MSQILTNNKHYSDIANTIRQMKNVNTTYKPREMASALKDVYSNEVEGTLPLTFQANGSNLLNYRIDGASGGVGEKTNNLFNPSGLVAGYYLDTNSGLPALFSTRCATVQPISINCNSLILKFDTNVNDVRFIYSLFNNDTLIRRVAAKISGATIDTTGANKIYISFYISTSSSTVLSPSDLTNVMLSENDIDYEPYGYELPVIVKSKNLIPEIYNGWYHSESGERVNNNSIATTDFIEIKPNTNYTTTLYDDQFNAVHFLTVRYWDANKTSLTYITNSATTTSPANAKYVTARTFASDSATSGTFYFQLEEGTVSTDYDSYHESPETTFIYLDSPIGANESISLSDTEVDIPTIDGTNILTIDTTVQPSNVYIQAPKDHDEIVYLTNFLKEEI